MGDLKFFNDSDCYGSQYLFRLVTPLEYRPKPLLTI